ncbi:MAG: pro-sigmaK processing inhibitor BofA family protein [Lachnospiraceae bacterium]|nr:pro-sigmaK processing inhibitor BofA family protein [Lachnospiraceae bacterium]
MNYSKHNNIKRGEIMEKFSGMAAILIVCTLVLFIGAFGRKIEWLINFVLRAVMGTIGIYFINYFLISQQISTGIGINPLTVLTSGFLGFPGLIVLYGINFFKLL